MSILRPARKVRAPGGEEWEIYVYRVDLTWRPFEVDADLWDGGGYGRAGLVEFVVSVVQLPLVLLGQVVLPAAIAVLRFPIDLVRSRSSQVWHVEAVHWRLGNREAHRWRTTGDHRDRVLEQVARAFEAGEPPWRAVLGADYEGRSGW